VTQCVWFERNIALASSVRIVIQANSKHIMNDKSIQTYRDQGSGIRASGAIPRSGYELPPDFTLGCRRGNAGAESRCHRARSTSPTQNRSVRWLLVTANVPSSPILVTLMT
jgi:hypothetical protein